MITTLRVMRRSRIKSSIIRRTGLWAGLLCAAFLTGCSSVRLAYSNAPQLAWWWLDGYVDFSREQAPQAKQAIDRFFEWHRSTQLSEYLPLLAAAQPQILEPTTAALACRWQDQIRERLEPSLERALGLAADLLPGLGESQFKAIEKRFVKVNDEMRDDFLQADPAQRQDESVKRALERAERLYGTLDEAQKRVIAAGVATSPFDPELWLLQRQRRQRETVQTLRRLAAEHADHDQRLAALRALAARAERSPDALYRAYQLKLGEYNCAFAAQIHNATTVAQRQRARENLKGWEEDLRSLMAAN
jgi:hypothetical protein